MQNHSKDHDIADYAGEHSGFLPYLPTPGRIGDDQVAIADMADAFGVTHRTLHFYEEKGLLCANRMGAMRVYGAEDIRRMTIINACREIDMTVADIQDLMKALESSASAGEAARIFGQALNACKRELTARQSILRRQVERIGELLESSADGGLV